MNIASNKIKIFPSARRNFSGDRFSRLMSESTLVSLINKLVDKDGFVITSEFSSNSPLEFNIHGYYFRIESDGISSLLSNSSNVYATITLSEYTSNKGNAYLELVCADTNDVCTGVEFSDTAQTGTNKYCLQLLTKENNTWVIPEDSKVKFKGESVIPRELIDGGII